MAPHDGGVSRHYVKEPPAGCCGCSRRHVGFPTAQSPGEVSCEDVTKKSAIAVMREEILVRDGLTCKGCDGTCRKCKPPSSTLAPAAYFKIEGTRAPQNRMTLGHARGHHKRQATLKEGWRDLVAQCYCCNIGQTTAIKEKCLSYTATLPEIGTARFEEAKARRDAEVNAQKARGTAVRQKEYQRVKAMKKGVGSGERRIKRGTSVAKGKLPQKVLDQKSRSVLNGQQ